MYVVAIAASHTPLGGVSLGIDLLVSNFPHSALRLRPATHTRVPVWDLAVFLEGLSAIPFEPIEEVPEKLLTFKALFLLDIASLMRI